MLLVLLHSDISYARSIRRPNARAWPSCSTVAMGNSRNTTWVCGAALGLCAVGLMCTAAAAPPLARAAAHMDLHPPLVATDADEQTPTVFPSSLHRQTLGARVQLQLPGLGSEGAQS